ncbi:hypothetical protein Tco_0726708 [Tanacetum coccineum]|uniref:Uncharacterized protein n=1 Tax=Tanacetum coccineum TaxID=301880 RepID=A0ABQ4YIU5_9ASTR
MKPDIENKTLNEYLEYEAEKERRLRDNVRSKKRPTNYDEADIDSFHQNKRKTFSYPYSHSLTPPHPCFLHVQQYPKNCFLSSSVSNNVCIDNMTIAEYNLYVAKLGLDKNLLNNHSYGFTPQIGAKNMKRMGQDKVQDSIWEQDNDLEEDQEDDGDDRDTFDMWDITVKDVERIRQFLTPNVPDIIEDVMQPLIPTTLHTTSPNEDYVAPATKPILDELLEDKILNVAMFDEEADPTRDLEEPERLLVEDPYFRTI